jgi:hypothetical protein
MTMTVSISQTGQEQSEPPTREERDAACSSDAGRKAVEKPIDRMLSRKKTKKEEGHPQAPIGLDMETVADEFLDKKP